MEVTTAPYVPLSHPFLARLIGRIRSAYLDRTLFWTTVDLDAKSAEFPKHSNGHRAQAGVEGGLPEPGADGSASPFDLEFYRFGSTVEGCTRLQSSHDL